MNRTSYFSGSAIAIATALACVLPTVSGTAFAHGDVVPQAVDTEGLKALPEGEWLDENPYRGNKQAIEIGSSAYGQNCARCHGLDAVSGGIAPDLRELGPEYDDYFIGKVRGGVQRNGMTYMPAFEGTLSQEAMWAIRSYIDKRHYEYNDKDLAKLYEQAEDGS
ncbi:cytochrome c-550 PedF [Endozoicomonas sp. G2_2]|uniref:cytochrome c-550 PedF n=1 Tax=Gammaproteobacteria TaxID=1236 RepID=UPI000C3D4416|nr:MULTISPECIES: cytochrome c-550 PedF [Gammaproteobacteria]MAS08702.1 cytochrome c-550 PedF [Salinisphaera sp.]MBO9468545.1 cytochrome c-550 PedF [Endozoicomonas sp. G2_2]|tara:strand:- start:590 stop:1081 length:492 start_codon:yes stop_codon:yes gene_type:complete